ncbi:MAG: hypothetical protein M3552_06470 [Planctomycetota bacterium]|nr:hypothetical protein [Planctomycetaceae bacterium]MDQ3330280.1 hypothetical protein [Planctomycetota bacterium]
MTTEVPVGVDHRFRGPLIVAAVLAVAWLGFLSVLALLAANPATVNREQILRSDAVVVGVAESPAKSGVWLRVEETLAGSEIPSRLRLEGVPADQFALKQRYIVPLIEDRGRYAVTPAPPALKGMRLVYPAEQETINAATKIRATAAEMPYR